MQWLDLAKSGVGAIVGFMLAQVVNLAAIWYRHRNRPVLRIETYENSRLLSHGAEVGLGQILKEEIYGFGVRNVGRTIASGVRFQVTAISIRREAGDPFIPVFQHSMELSVFETASRRGERQEATIVPGAVVDIGLAWWREGSWSIHPLTNAIPDYYDETCGDALAYRFSVVAFDDSRHFVTAEIDVEA